MSHEATTYLHIGARVPRRLAEAVEARAELLGVSKSDVIASGLVREVCAPVDRRSRMFVDAWLDGLEVEPATDDAPQAQE